MRYSLRSGLIALGVLLLLMLLGLGGILLGVFRQGMDALVAQAHARARTACEVIDQRLRAADPASRRLASGGADEQTKSDLAFLLDVVLGNFDGVEGGSGPLPPASSHMPSRRIRAARASVTFLRPSRLANDPSS